MSADGRGRHRGRRSPETKRWHEYLRSTDQLQPPKPAKSHSAIAESPPPRLSWMDDGEYAALLELRADLEGDAS